MLRRINERIVQLRQLRGEILQLLQIEEAESPHRADTPDYAPLRARFLGELKVAAIMDRFTLDCFAPECRLTQLTPAGWREEMEEAQPDLLFIESAWQGKDGLWHGKVNYCAPELYELTEYCHQKSIPVVFWNKEDPVFTDTFMATARRADVVFTTDLECVEKYKTELGHDRVYHLHFAAQPRIHNPIEKYERADRFCFAGAYYHRYQDRCQVFDAFSDYFIQARGLDIYDRNYPEARPEHKFPQRYDPYILGRLDPSEIDRAYKGYDFGINMNSAPQSQTMFARRVFELMASNTIVIGNYCRGVKNYFGDLTFCTDDAKTLEEGLQKYCGDRVSMDKLRLLALRKVLREHLCEDRLDEVVRRVYGKSLKKPLPSICVLARVDSQAQADRAAELFRRQTYGEKRLVLVSSQPIRAPQGAALFSREAFDPMPVSQWLREEFLACFDPGDWYGPHYLEDLALTIRYGAFRGIGKAEYFLASGSQVRREGEGLAYRPAPSLCARRAMVHAELLRDCTGSGVTAQRVWEDGELFAVDSMNYCQGWSEGDCPAAADLELPDQGIPLERIEHTAETISALLPGMNTKKIEAGQIAQMKIGRGEPVQAQLQGKRVELASALPEDVHRYFQLGERLELAPLLEDGKLTVRFGGEGTLNVMGCCLFYDGSDKKLEGKTPRLGRRETLTPPEGAVFLRLAYRVRGAGTAALYDIELGASSFSSVRGGCFLSRSNVLVLTNHYPAPEDLYRNMFVHKRLTSYREQGCLVDVMRMHPHAKEVFREFEGINVVEGHGEMLSCALSAGGIDTVCVHFLDQDMWDALKPFLGTIRLIIWSHGADIQPWWRRTFNYHTGEELEQAKVQSERRMKLWQDVFQTAKRSGGKINLIFVSEYARRIVEEDYNCSLKDISVLIPNLIDTQLFTYIPKAAADRLQIVSVRPYSSEIYANDLSVRAIELLSQKPWFKELNITLVGKGPLFVQLTSPLEHLENVTLRETFLRQSEIAELYHKNGIVLIPTRGDTQGVSRDEAMASGLVPVTNAVAAIPEFVDESCGILAPAEDFEAIAAGIERLYHDPELFLTMSENAARRVRSQTSREYTIDKELQLIFPEQFCREENGFLTVATRAAGRASPPAEITVEHGEMAAETYRVNCPSFTVPLSVPGDYRVTCTDSQGRRCRNVYSGAPQKNAAVSIFGSCTTRDCLRLFPARAFQLKSYIARQSVVSAVSEPAPLELDEIRLESPFQRRAVWQDFSKNAFDILAHDGSSWIILDLIDERFPLTEIGGAYVTKSALAVQGGAVAEDAPTAPRVSNGKDYFVNGRCLREFIGEFCRRLRAIYSEDHIIIHRALTVEQYWTAEGELRPYTDAELETGKALNALITYMYDVLEEELPQAHVIDCMSGWHGSGTHAWGVATVHYEDGYYAQVIQRLGEIIFRRKTEA